MPTDSRQTSSSGWFTRWARSLRFPWLLLITVIVLGVDLVVPDLLPFVDEILLALVSLVLATIRKRRRGPARDGDATVEPGAAQLDKTPGE